MRWSMSTALYWLAAVGVAEALVKVIKLELHRIRPDARCCACDVCDCPDGACCYQLRGRSRSLFARAARQPMTHAGVSSMTPQRLRFGTLTPTIWSYLMKYLRASATSWFSVGWSTT